MVIIKDDNLPPLKWVLRRIERTIPGPDEMVRVADVRKLYNILRRPIHKLALLPIEEHETNEGDNVTDTTQQQNPRSRKRKSSANLATLLLTCLFLPFISCSKVEVIPFTEDAGIYYEQIGLAAIMTSNWNLINYFDVRPYWRESDTIYKYVSTVSQLCNLMDNRGPCRKIETLLNKRLKIIRDSNELLQNNQRTKRGAFNFVGNVANDLFDLLDADYAEKLVSTIENLQTNDEVLKRDAENFTTFMDRTLSILKKTETEVEKEFKVIEGVVNQLTSNVVNISQEVRIQGILGQFNEFALQTVIRITEYQNVQEALFNILTDAHHGNINAELLTPKELQHELDSIDPNLLKTTMLPLPTTEISQYYRIMTISHKLTANYVIFNINIALISSRRFELLKLSAIPFIQNKTLHKLQLSTKFLVVDLLRYQYYALSENQRQHCISIDGNLYFCQPSKPLYNQHSQENQCEFSILKEARLTTYCHSMTIGTASYWYRLQDPNAWLFAVANTELLNVVCSNNPSQLTIRGTGILRFGGDCTIKTSQMILEGHTTITRLRQISYAPNCNISTIRLQPPLKTLNYSVSYDNNHEEIRKLKEELNEFKTISLTKIRPHDIHHYGSGYVIFGLIICGSIFLTVRHCNIKRNSRTPPRPAPRSQDVQSEEQVFSMFSS